MTALEQRQQSTSEAAFSPHFCRGHLLQAHRLEPNCEGGRNQTGVSKGGGDRGVLDEAARTEETTERDSGGHRGKWFGWCNIDLSAAASNKPAIIANGAKVTGDFGAIFFKPKTLGRNTPEVWEVATSRVRAPESRKPCHGNKLADRKLQALARKLFHVVLNRHEAQGRGARGREFVVFVTCASHCGRRHRRQATPTALSATKGASFLFHHAIMPFNKIPH